MHDKNVPIVAYCVGIGKKDGISGLCQVLRTAMLHANASFASVRALVRLNTGEFLNALRLNDEIRRGVPRTFPACSTRVCFGTSHPHSSVTIIIEPGFISEWIERRLRKRRSVHYIKCGMGAIGGCQSKDWGPMLRPPRSRRRRRCVPFPSRCRGRGRRGR